MKRKTIIRALAAGILLLAVISAASAQAIEQPVTAYTNLMVNESLTP